MYKKIITKSALSPIICALFLTACSSGESLQTSTKVIAKVNGDEITLNQLNTELQKIKIRVSDSSQTSQKILTGLIDRQLLMQEASKLNLDRLPEVQEAVASAKAQIYAQAYIARKLTKLTSPTKEEIKQYINEHPYYFSQRLVFHTLDSVFENQPQKIDLKRLESEVTTLDTLHAALNEHGVPFQTASSQFSTDGLPQSLLEKIKQTKAGDLLFAYDGNKVIVRSVYSVELYPVLGQQAEQIAGRILSEQQRQSFVLKEIARLKKLSTIEVLDTSLAFKQNDQALVANPHE